MGKLDIKIVVRWIVVIIGIIVALYSMSLHYEPSIGVLLIGFFIFFPIAALVFLYAAMFRRMKNSKLRRLIGNKLTRFYYAVGYPFFTIAIFVFVFPLPLTADIVARTHFIKVEKIIDAECTKHRLDLTIEGKQDEFQDAANIGKKYCRLYPNIKSLVGRQIKLEGRRSFLGRFYDKWQLVDREK